MKDLWTQRRDIRERLGEIEVHTAKDAAALLEIDNPTYQTMVSNPTEMNRELFVSWWLFCRSNYLTVSRELTYFSTYVDPHRFQWGFMDDVELEEIARTAIEAKLVKWCERQGTTPEWMNVYRRTA